MMKNQKIFRKRPSVKINNKGFTLMELLIVVFLITIILSLSAFFFAGFLPSSQFNATGREISAMIQRTRSLTRMNMESHTFMIDLDNRSYGIAGVPAKNIPPGILIKVIDPFSGEIPQGKYSIVFNPGGAVSGGTIVLSRGKRTLRIELDPITGAVLTHDQS